MIHRATAGFWRKLVDLPPPVRARADKQFALLRVDPSHPSLQFKKLGTRDGEDLWSARVTLSYRALALRRKDGFLWFWVGDHTSYEALIG